jgi:uncharacterized RDD family membrane protein YckC
VPAPTSKSIPFGQLAPSQWPGERLGLPQSGRGSVGRPGRRIAALAIDWALAYAVSALFFRSADPTAMNVTITLCFVVMQSVFIPTIGGSIGHRLVGLRIVPLAGGWVGLWRPVVRSVLLALVIPALVWDSDQRGFHDKIAATVLIRA